MNHSRTKKSMRLAAPAIALAVFAGACASSESEPVDIESLGLAIEAEIQPGATFEVAVPAIAETSVVVVSTPPGVTASISEGSGGESMVLSVAVEPDTSQGEYNVLLRAERNGGDGAELEWPFAVAEPESVMPVEQPAPESLRDEVLAAVATKDVYVLRALWPSSTWESLGVPVLESFVAGSEVPACNRLADDRAHCVVFEADIPRALEMTMELGGDGWTITAMSWESTN